LRARRRSKSNNYKIAPYSQQGLPRVKTQDRRGEEDPRLTIRLAMAALGKSIRSMRE
jgi:hypothetical protein